MNSVQKVMHYLAKCISFEAKKKGCYFKNEIKLVFIVTVNNTTA